MESVILHLPNKKPSGADIALVKAALEATACLSWIKCQFVICLGLPGILNEVCILMKSLNI